MQPAAALKTLYISRSQLHGLKYISEGIAKFNALVIAIMFEVIAIGGHSIAKTLTIPQELAIALAFVILS